MKLPSRYSALVLLSAVLVSLTFLAWVNRGRMERVEHVSGLGAEGAMPDPATATGWAGNRRWLIASEHNNDSYQWIMETQQMLAVGDWRLRRVTYDNGNDSREIGSPAPYRWWLAAVANANRALTGNSLPLAVEKSALVADPVLLVGILLAGMIVLAWRLGAWPAAVWLVAGSLLYPFSAAFVPGAPDSLGLSLGLAVASVLLVVTSSLGAARSNGAGGTSSWMVAAGMAGGLGLWVNGFVQLPVLLGLAVGGAVVAWTQKAQLGPDNPRHWRLWGWSGALTSLAAYALEYLPAHLSWTFKGNHPAVAFAWLGAGELVALLSAGRCDQKLWTGWVFRGRMLGALLCIAVLPVIIWKSGESWLAGRDVFGTRLTSLPLAGVAENFGAWLGQEGGKLQIVAVLLPLGLTGYALWLGWRKSTISRERSALMLAVVPLVVVLPFAWFQLRWWSLVEGMLLVLVVAVTAVLAREIRRVALNGWLVALMLALLPGLVCHRPKAKAQYEHELSQFEVEGLVERSLAHWLAERAAQVPVVLAPPFRTTALCFHGNMRGLGSLNLENKEALGAAARIASATTPEEAQALITKRGVSHIIMPSWDVYLEEYARLFTSRPENSFVFALKKWAMPPWLIPVAYQLPTIGGFEDQTIFIFEAAEEQDQATTLGRLAEYFLEMGQGDLAMSAAQGLAGYPENLPALAALAQIELARGDAARFAGTFKTLLAVYSAAEEHDLSWDRRVSLAVVLMQGKQPELARREMEIALNLMDEAGLRSLSVGSLYRFQVLLKALDLKIEDEKLRRLAAASLPESLRSQL
jgi:hypothetical protein